MAFDRPIEADSVDDLGLISSLIRAPVLGIMWLLGGEHTDSDNELSVSPDDGDAAESDSVDDRVGSSNERCQDREKINIDNDDPTGESSSTPSEPRDQSKIKGIGTENKENELSFLNKLSSAGSPDSSEEHMSKCKSEKSIPRSSRQSSRRDDQSHDIDPATETMDDLVTVMERRHIGNPSSSSDSSPGPATSAVLTSQIKVTASSSTNSLTACYSASTFSDHEKSRPESLHSSNNTGVHPSQMYRGNKKMSWSDECGKRSLVEYSDEPAISPQSKHWSAMKRSTYRASRHSFDGGEKATATRRSEVKVIKSALKRSGSYNPPPALYASNAKGSGSSTSLSTGASTTPSSPEVKSFRSISVIGSLDSSNHLSRESTHSVETDDSMDAVTNKNLNSNEVHCIPSTLQSGCGLASGGLIIPRGGPSDPRYYYPRGGLNGPDPRYQLILGTGIPTACRQQSETSEQEEKSAHDAPHTRPDGLSNPVTGSRNSPGRHPFLPRQPNGYISPQYGFYVNITPPTPEMYGKSGDKSSRHVQQQSYQQFQFQNKFKSPSSIPEGCPGVTQGIPQRHAGNSNAPRPSSKARQNFLKPTFTKNKKGMGMLLAENSHHGVWPTVPFG